MQAFFKKIFCTKLCINWTSAPKLQSTIHAVKISLEVQPQFICKQCLRVVARSRQY